MKQIQFFAFLVSFNPASISHSLKTTLIITLLFAAFALRAQPSLHFADSIRNKYKIPELGYAVLSGDSIIELNVIGTPKAGSGLKAQINDRFRIGSNTKTVTSYLAFLLVKQGRLSWETRFFDLYPELKAGSDNAYHTITLRELITFRAPLTGWTYTNETPTQAEIKGDDRRQRYEFVKWTLEQAPDTAQKTVYWSNPAYVAAGLMLEKASGKSYEALVAELGAELGIAFGFGQPNSQDPEQPWGHSADLKPEKPGDNYRLNWLSSAGNINVSLPGYAKFIQLQLRGLRGKPGQFSQQEFDTMHYGLPEFAYGWQTQADVRTNKVYSYHRGNPGTFLSVVYISRETDRAYIFFANVQSERAARAIEALFNALSKKYEAG